MTRTATTKRQAAYERRYRALAAKISEVGYISSGTVTQRSTRCGTKTCRCHADPPQLHGPYWQWTAKIDGKTVTRRLTQSEAALYQEWIANDRHLRSLIDKMRSIAAQATALALKNADQPAAKV